MTHSPATHIKSDPPRDCPRCPRLAEFRNAQRDAHPEWFNAPVPSFGPSIARLLIVGLAPGLQGANRTGRPFTGDYAGDLLYETIAEFGFSAGTFAARPDDGLQLCDAMITNAVRCVPPQNKPTGPEIKSCQPFLVTRIETLPNLAAVLALGRIAHDATLDALGQRRRSFPFGHGARHPIEGPENKSLTLFDSYHCSRYNTNTRRLTSEMFQSVFRAIKEHIDAIDNS